MNFSMQAVSLEALSTSPLLINSFLYLYFGYLLSMDVSYTGTHCCSLSYTFFLSLPLFSISIT
jgi:hypothetical protein